MTKPGKPATGPLLLGIVFAGAGVVFLATDHGAAGAANLGVGLGFLILGLRKASGAGAPAGAQAPPKQ